MRCWCCQVCVLALIPLSAHLVGMIWSLWGLGGVTISLLVSSPDGMPSRLKLDVSHGAEVEKLASQLRVARSMEDRYARLEPMFQKMEARVTDAFIGANNEAYHLRRWEAIGRALFVCAHPPADAPTSQQRPYIVSAPTLGGICQNDMSTGVSINSVTPLPPQLRASSGYAYGTTAHGVLMLLTLLQAAVDAAGINLRLRGCVLHRPSSIAHSASKIVKLPLGGRTADLELLPFAAESYAWVTGFKCLPDIANFERWNLDADFCWLQLGKARSPVVAVGPGGINDIISESELATDSTQAYAVGSSEAETSGPLSTPTSKTVNVNWVMTAGFVLISPEFQSDKGGRRLLIVANCKRGYVISSTRELLLFDNNIAAGASGGPIVDSRGTLLAIAVGAMDSHDMSTGLPAESIRAGYSIATRQWGNACMQRRLRIAMLCALAAHPSNYSFPVDLRNSADLACSEPAGCHHVLLLQSTHDTDPATLPLSKKLKLCSTTWMRAS